MKKPLLERARVSVLIAAAIILGLIGYRVLLAFAFLLAVIVVGNAIDHALERYSHGTLHSHP